MLQQALSSGYFNSVITTIEKRFDFSSQMSGAIVSTFELGNLATIIFVSYYGMSRHVPRWIGTGVLLIAFGSIMFSIPHFISSNDHDDHNGTMESSRIDGEQYCRLNETIGNNGEKTKCSNGNDIPPQVYIFMFAMIMIGSGGTPIFTLGTTYIDDHVPECRSSTYMSFLYGMVGFGLVFGFLLGGTCIAIHENIFGNVPLGVTINSSRWIGAWWIGFILLGILLLIVAIPFFIFPKRLKCIKEKRQSGNNQIEIEQQIPNHSPKKLVRRQQSLSEIPSCLIRLITNPVYMITSLGSCMELAIASGFIIFLPKFLETQFEMTKSEANLMAGSVAIPGACFGIFLGSYLLQRFQLNTRGAIQMVLLFNIICCSIFMGVYFIGCPNISMAGINVPYPNDVNHTEFNLSSNCNNGCHCSTNQYEPMCDQRTGTTFYSPCFAGCRQSLKQDIEECLCLEANHTSILITSGTCLNQCGKYLYPFMFLLFIVTLLSSITQMPVVKATLRSVSQEDRSLALGLQFVLFRLFGYIPSPILFGQIIDQTCLIYKTNCNQMPSGFCMLYDVEEFRQRYIGICISLKIVSFIFFLIDLLYICYREKSETSIIVAGDDDDDVDEIKDDCALMANHNNDNNDIDDFEQLPIVSMNHDGRHNNCPTIIETNEDCHSIDSNGSFNMVPITSAMIKCSPNDSSF
ncbi:hypothetical protein RDWZM_002331 [Blomia tropicalis]|uniref:Solute carrier organic anion transporter family member n=1 Tax=Blomia tropicalis TaxID=40697 RepID=A0A9Q0MDA9_BLOTA|nr:hypothetical protein RDWZM_002331 [Blomia tropicalis]